MLILSIIKKVDLRAKEASVREELWESNLTNNEIMNFLRSEYINIDSHCFEQGSKRTGSYYLSKFSEIKIKFLKGLTSNRKDCCILTRIVTGFPMTKVYLR